MGGSRKQLRQTLLASVLGSAAYDALKREWHISSESDAKRVRVFQRAFVIVVETGAIAPEVADTYLQRIAALSTGRRKEYVSSILQPPTGEPDDRQTAVVIRNHALMSDVGWQSLTAAFNLDRPTVVEGFSAGFTDAVNQLNDRAAAINQQLEREIAHDKSEIARRRSLTWLQRFRSVFSFNPLR